jgi:hypothetical protein
MYTECLTADADFTAKAVVMGTTMTEDLIADTSTIEDWFATMPALPAVAPQQQLPDEEELHTSFEHAISNRLIAVNRQLSLISGPLTDSGQAHGYVTGQLKQASLVPNIEVAVPLVAYTSPRWLGTAWQRSLIMISLALMFLLVGFDLMGLLVLHAH